MLHKCLGRIQWLEFELLEPFRELRHAIFLRHGGCSQGPYSSLNLSRAMGDECSHVESNLSKVKATLGFKSLAECFQVHRDGVKVVNAINCNAFDEYDALMTEQPHLGLKVAHADCQAAILYDPVRRAVATVHCGWRGHVCNIYAKVIEAMKGVYGTRSADLHVAIGPSLGPQHAEFLNYRTEFPEIFWEFRLDHDRFDLWELARWQLTQAGILASHIQIAEICTFGNQEDYFSFRRSKRVTGAHGTVAALSF